VPATKVGGGLSPSSSSRFRQHEVLPTQAAGGEACRAPTIWSNCAASRTSLLASGVRADPAMIRLRRHHPASGFGLRASCEVYPARVRPSQVVTVLSQAHHLVWKGSEDVPLFSTGRGDGVKASKNRRPSRWANKPWRARCAMRMARTISESTGFANTATNGSAPLCGCRIQKQALCGCSCFGALGNTQRRRKMTIKCGLFVG